MKRDHSLPAALLLLLGTLGLLAVAADRLGGDRERVLARGQAIGTWLLQAQLGELAAVPAEAAVSPEPEAAVPAGEKAPVTTVTEAWDEEARRVEPAESSSRPVALGSDFSLELRNETDYEVDFADLPDLPAGLELDTKAPVILLMHTHGSEGYAGSSDGRTQDQSQSVIAVGDRLAQTLEARGYGVIHDKTLCDYPEYSGAYDRSREVIRENLAQYPSIVLVIDLHRDAVEDENGTPQRLLCTLDGAEAAQLMLVVGTDAGGLAHPAWRENLSLAAVLQARLARDCPGLMRPLNLRRERFNQDLAPLDLLVEVGASGNDLEEALRSAELLGRALGDTLDQYSGKSS